MTIKTTHSQFESALAAARGAEPLSEAHKRALMSPPRTFVMDAGAAEMDGFSSIGGNVNVHAFAQHMLEQHAERVTRVERILAILDGNAALDAYEAPRLLSFVAGQRRGIPRELTRALRLTADAHPLGVADALAAALRDLRTWRQNRPEPPTRVILARDRGVAA